MNAIPLSGLARRLVRDNILTEETAQNAFQSASSGKTPFVSYLVSENLCDSAHIAEAASDEFGAPLFDLSAFNMEMSPRDLVDIKLIQQHHTLPLYRRATDYLSQFQIQPIYAHSMKSNSIPALTPMPY